MHFADDPGTDQFRDEVRAVIDEFFSDDAAARVRRTGTYHDWALHRAIAARGWLAAALPESLGGQGRSPEQLSGLFRELEIAGAPYDGINLAMIVSYILAHVGSPFHRSEVLTALLSGEAVPCLGYSEPGVGSDLTSVITRARRDGDNWLIDGQKMFTSLAEEARWCLLLARTDPSAPQRRGLTYFLVPMDSPGIGIQEVRTLSGKRTNITFYDSVHVPDRYRVGEVNGGIDVMMVALAYERGIVGGTGDILALYRSALTWASRQASDGTRPLDDSSVCERLARTAIDQEVTELLGARAAWAAVRGQTPAQEGAECKLFSSEAYQRAAASLLDMAGSHALGGLDRDPGLEHAFLMGPIAALAGGTSEIQKNLIALRGLGLPRAH
jgi:alkylation response protein AidB-like acyl-CoA dehydrogenase